MPSSQGRVALVTGASSGIGHATALALAAHGFVTYATARRPEALAELRAQGLRTLTVDVTDEAALAAAVRTVEAEHGAVDVLVNNAGYGEMGPVEEVTLERWRDQFETNVFGLVRLSQLVLPGMRARGWGRIINVSSGGGEFTFPLAGAYHASKYAVESISDALRFEVRPFGIDVVVVQPSVVRTPLVDASLDSLRRVASSPYAALIESYTRQSRESIARGTAILTPEQIAAVIVRAALARQPRTRYKIGAIARVLPVLRQVLPDRAWDAMIARMFGIATTATPGRSTSLPSTHA